MHPNAKDMTGKKIGRWIVLGRAGTAKGSKAATWECKCSCGNKGIVAGTALRNGSSTSCGCFRQDKGRKRVSNMIGAVFGRLKVISRVESKIGKQKQRNAIWLCECSCGKRKAFRGDWLRKKGYGGKNCGCVSRTTLKDLTGQTFGRLEIVRRSGLSPRGEATWLCRCSCGKTKVVPGTYLRAKRKGTKSCGCLSREIRSKMHGHNHPNWKGGRRQTQEGYIALSNAIYPGSKPYSQTMEHVAVMARHLGRPLRKEETVHHLNGVRWDNRIENLELWASNHPSGQRASDLVAYAKEILEKYKPEALTGHVAGSKTGSSVPHRGDEVGEERKRRRRREGSTG